MGWCNEAAPGHEGFVVGLVQVDPENFTHWRELRYPGDAKKRTDVRMIQVACECGWRSQRFHAPFGTEWSPYSVSLPDEEIEEEARLLWRKHWETEDRKHAWKRLKPEQKREAKR